ncbi:Kinesin-like protein KLP1 [Diplonema papillatum]|nr:Kinesin-like protein KLP1 [Diplonema papillatum]
MGKGAVKVVLRTRPTEYFAANSLQFLEGSTVGFYYPRRKDKGPLNNTQEHYSFRLDDILHNASQERVFDATCRNIVDSVVQGFNGTIMAYGQTGAGKTYTMTGTHSLFYYLQWHHHGLRPDRRGEDVHHDRYSFFVLLSSMAPSWPTARPARGRRTP